MSWAEQRCKIRKRGCSSSPSSSNNLVFKYRFKKPPTWKMSTKSHSSKLSTGDLPNRSPSSCSLDAGKGIKESSVSAGKSAANNSQGLKNNLDVGDEDEKEVIKTREMISQISHSCLTDPDRSLKDAKTEKVEGDRVPRRRRRRRRSACSLRIGIGSNFHANHCLMEIENGNEGKTRRGKTKSMVKTGLKEVSNCLRTSKELLRVLNHLWGENQDDGERPSSSLSVITALKSEIDRAKSRVDHLMTKDESFHGDESIEVVMKRFAEEKAAWKYRERARVRSAISSMADEVEVERKLRRRAERLNKTIAKELSHAKLSLSKTIKDLQREKIAKEIFEEICEELAKGMGEERAELEELKKESAKVREEVEKEREMFQLADVLREERVQMKLCEAKYEFEEKNAAVQTLKHQLESAYFTTNNHQNPETEDYYYYTPNSNNNNNKFESKIKELEAYLKKINFGSSENHHQQQHINDEDEDCSESDLHSIELNMDDNNNNKSYRWSLVRGTSQRNSFEKLDHSNKIQWESICLNSATKGDQFVERFTEIFAQSTHTLQENESHHNKSSNCQLRDILFPPPAPTTNEQQIVEN